MAISVNYLSVSSAAWAGSLFGHEGQHYLNREQYTGEDAWKDEQSASRRQLGIGSKIGYTDAEKKTLSDWSSDDNRAAMQKHMTENYTY
jgi:hypothetical protein